MARFVYLSAHGVVHAINADQVVWVAPGNPGTQCVVYFSTPRFDMSGKPTDRWLIVDMPQAAVVDLLNGV